MTSVSPSGLPPIDHIARELWKRGAKTHALELLRACVMRDPTARASAALLRAVEARPDASVSGPDLALDVDLVDALAGQGMILEARALFLGARLSATDGQSRLERFDLVLVPVPPEIDRVWHDALAHVHMGAGRHALSLIEAEEARGNLAPAWVITRRNLLRELLSVTAVDRPSARPIGQSRLAVSVNPTEMMETSPDDDERTKVGKNSVRPPSVALPDETMRSAPVPEAVANERPSQSALRKRVPSGGLSGAYGRKRSPSALELGAAATSTLSLDQEADLLIKQGYPEQALALYRALISQPNHDARIAKRCDEIEALIAARTAPLAGEPTTRRVDEALRQMAVRTDAMPAVAVPSVMPPIPPSDFPSGVMSTIPAPNVNEPLTNSSVVVRRILRVG